jgi:hypothetical protein
MSEYLLEHGWDSLETLQLKPPLKFAYQAMFAQLRHFNISLFDLLASSQDIPRFSDLNKQRLYALNHRPPAFPTSVWVDLAKALPLSVETIKLTDTTKPLWYKVILDLVKMLAGMINAKTERLPNLRGMCLVDVTSEFAHPVWAMKRQQRIDPDSSLPTMEIRYAYDSDAERRQAGIHYWCTDLRRLACTRGVEIHTNPVEGCVGWRSTMFCRVRDDEISAPVAPPWFRSI